jgi:hypothetical protein
MDTNLPSLLLCGFLLMWIVAYWVFPVVLVRLRQPRRTENIESTRFLAETGTIHRLGRGDSSETA